jgi:hypothetical protein
MADLDLGTLGGSIEIVDHGSAVADVVSAAVGKTGDVMDTVAAKATNFGNTFEDAFKKVESRSFESQKSAQEMHRAFLEAFENPIDAMKQFGQSLESDVLGSLGKVGLVAAAVVGSISGITFAITELGEKGSTIIGVEDAFKRLTSAIGQDADVMINALSAGVKGTVSSFELMQDVNKALAAGVTLTSANMATLGEAARITAKSMGTDTTSAVDLLSNALIRGNTRVLQRAGIVIDAKKAETDFAHSIGTTADQLNSLGQIEAKRQASLKAMADLVAKAGVQELTLKERIQQGEVAISSWVEKLEVAVAKSPAVNAAFTAISEAFSHAFGSAGTSLLDTLVAGIDKFSRGVVAAVPYFNSLVDAVKTFWGWLVELNDKYDITGKATYIVEIAFAALRDAFDFVTRAAKAAVDAWQQMPPWLQQIAVRSAEVTAALYLTGKAVDSVSSPMTGLISAGTSILSVLANLAQVGGVIPSIFKTLGSVFTTAEVAVEGTAAGAAAADISIAAVGETAVGAGAGILSFATGIGEAILVIGGITAAVIFLEKNWSSVRSALVTGANAVKTAFDYVSDSLVGRFLIAITELGLKLAGWTVEKLGIATWKILTDTWDALATIVDKLSSAFKNISSFDFASLGQKIMLAGDVAGLHFTDAKNVLAAIVPLLERATAAAERWNAATAKPFGIGAPTPAGPIPLDSNALPATGQLAPAVTTSISRSATAGAAASGAAANRLKYLKDIQTQVDKLIQSWEGDSQQIRIVSAALDELATKAGLPEALQVKMVDEMDKLIGMHKTLTAAQQTFYDAHFQLGARDIAMQTAIGKSWDDYYQEVAKGQGNSLDTENAATQKWYDAQYTAIAKLGKSHEDEWQRLIPINAELYQKLTNSAEAYSRKITDLNTKTAQDITKQYAINAGFSGGSTSTTQASLDEQEAAQVDNLNKQKLHFVDWQNQMTLIELDYGLKRINAGGKQQLDAQNALDDQIEQMTDTSEDYQVAKIMEAAAKKKAASDAIGEEQKKYFATVDALAALQVSQLSYNAQTIKNNTFEQLDATSAKEAATYDMMAAQPEKFSKRAIAAQKAVSLAADATARQTGTVWTDAFESVASAIPGLLQQAFTGGGGLLGAAKATGSLIGSEYAKAFLKSDTGQDLVKGMGDMWGKVFSNILPVIGGLVGPIISWIAGLFDHTAEDLGRDSGQKFGTTFSKNTYDAIVATMNTGVSELGSELINFSSIITDAGGLTTKNIGMMTDRLHDTFSLFATGQLTAAQATKVLNDNFATFTTAATDKVGVLSDKMKVVVQLAQTMGLNAKAVTDYISGQAGTSATALNTALGTGAGAYTQKASDVTQIATLNQQNPGTQTADVQKQIADLNADMITQQGIIDATAIKTQQAADGASGAILGTIAKLGDAGVNLVDAIKQADPAIQALGQQLKAAGLEGGAAFDYIKKMSDLAHDSIAGPALQAAYAFGDSMVSLSNIGGLTEDTFKGLSGQINQTYTALVAQGQDPAVVLSALQKPLQQIWELEQTGKYTVDDATQSLVDQAAAAGEVGEAQKSSADQMIDAIKDVTKDLDALLTHFGVDLPNAVKSGAEAAAGDLTKNFDSASNTAAGAVSRIAGAINNLPEGHIKFNVDQPQLPDLSGGGDNGGSTTPIAMSTGGIVPVHNIVTPEYHDVGGHIGNVIPFVPRGTDTVAVMATPGERMLTVPQTQAYDNMMGQLNQDEPSSTPETGSSATSGTTVNLLVDGRIMASVVLEHAVTSATQRTGQAKRLAQSLAAMMPKTKAS